MQFTTIGMITFADVPKPQMPGANGLSSTVSQLSMGAGIALGAMSIRAGHAIAQGLHIALPAAEYRIAFLIVAAVSLAGAFSTRSACRRDAGASFSARTRGTRTGAGAPPTPAEAGRRTSAG